MKTVIVVGNGMVGYKFCEKFVSKSSSDEYKLIVFGEEPRPAYDRVHLSEYFENQDANALELAPASWYKENNIELITGQRVTDIKKENKEIHTASGKSYTYDYLILATGSVPFVPPISGVEKEGVFVYRTIEDLEEMMAYASQIKAIKPNGKAAILGGGLLGLEAGKAVLDMGLEAPMLLTSELQAEGMAINKPH